MLHKVQVFLFVVGLIMLLGVDAEIDSSENLEEARECIQPYKTCSSGGTRCCGRASCRCPISGSNCKCTKPVSQIIADWFSG
uniref:Toxin 28 isoform a n=1 Tax=Cupiennius salei TaxID=6928 RepID=A0A4Y5UHS9_CUPSA|nr:toxin 28 isoform a precursor [Cupiennius salei]